MLRNSITRKIMGGGVARSIRRYSTHDWEGVHGYTGDTKLPLTAQQPASSSTPLSNTTSSSTISNPKISNPQAPETKKPDHKVKSSSILQQDEDLKAKLEAISGGGGQAGVQSEDGKNVGLRRGVRENMFRII